jgi:hypothetical protein
MLKITPYGPERGDGPQRRKHQKRPADREPLLIVVPVIVLGALVLTLAGLILPPLWTAVVEGWQARPPAQDCSILKDAAVRQACNEERGGRAPPPAKVPVFR